MTNEETNHRDTEVAEVGHTEGGLAGLMSKIIAAAMDVHRALGPGWVESAYEPCLAWELNERGNHIARQVPVSVPCKGVSLGCGCRLDLLVDNAVIVELKTVRAFEPIHTAQLLTYLRMASCRVGLLLNFNAPTMKDGIKRVSL